MQKFSNKKLFPLYAALLSAVLYLIILAICGILGYGNSTILTGDLYQQYIAFIRLFLDALRGKGSFWYSFSVYLGSPTAATFAYYCLSPFNLLYLIPGISASAMTIVVIVLKHALAAAAFQYFCAKGLKNNSAITILAGVAYSLCGFAVAMQMHLMWLDAFYILPILMLLMIRFVDGTSGLPLCLAYAYLFLTNFLMGYIAGVFSGLCFIALLYIKKYSIKNAFKKIGAFALYVLLAAGLCAAVLLPAAGQLLGQRGGDSEGFNLAPITLADVFGNLFAGQLQSMGSPVPLIYCGLPVLLLLPLYFRSKAIAGREKQAAAAILCIYLTATQFTPLYMFMHAFEAPNWFAHRYAFCIAFLLLALAVRALPEIKNINTPKICLYAAGLVFFYSLLIPLQKISLSGYTTASQGWLLVNALFLFGYIFLVALSQKQFLEKLLPPLLVIVFSTELIANACPLIKRNSFGYVSENELNGVDQTESTAIDEIKAADPGLYRIRTVGETMLNAPCFHHYAGLNTFNSIDPKGLRATLSSLGIAAPFALCYDQGFTPLTDMLLGLKYSAAISEDVYSISVSDTALPLGYMVNEEILNWQPSDDPFENQQQLASAMSGRDYVFFTGIEADSLQVSPINMDIYPLGGQIYFHSITPQLSAGTVSYSVPKAEEGRSYFYVLKDGSPSLDRSAPYISGEASAYSLPAYIPVKAITAAKDMEDGREGVSLEFPADSAADYVIDGLLIYRFDASQLSALHSELSSQPLTVTSWRDGFIDGEVTATADKPVLFTSIPYDKGWSVSIDGMPSAACAVVNSSFLAISLEPGSHHIVLEYEDPLMLPGRLIGGLAVIALLLTFLHQFKKAKDRAMEQALAASMAAHMFNNDIEKKGQTDNEKS